MDPKQTPYAKKLWRIKIYFKNARPPHGLYRNFLPESDGVLGITHRHVYAAWGTLYTPLQLL